MVTYNTNGHRGFTIVPIIPLDNIIRRNNNNNNEKRKKILLESRVHITLPEPEFVIGTDGTSVMEMGIRGDVNVDIEQINLIVHL